MKKGKMTLKSRLLESLENAYRTPVSVLPNRDLKAVKDQFLEAVLSPIHFLDKLQRGVWQKTTLFQVFLQPSLIENSSVNETRETCLQSSCDLHIFCLVLF